MKADLRSSILDLKNFEIKMDVADKSFLRNNLQENFLLKLFDFLKIFRVETIGGR